MPFSQHPDDNNHLKDHQTEAQLFASRVVVAFLGVVVLFGVLVYRFHDLQLNNYQHFATRADSNRVQVQPVPPTRGLIYDRNGILLADNRPSYTLSIVKERTPDLERTLDRVAELITVEDTDRSAFYKGLQQRRRPLEGVPLRYRLTEEEIATIAVNEYRLEGVEVEATLVRYYPYGELFTHTLGYVGRINDRELSGFDEDTDRRYSGTHSIGKMGVEKQYESVLLGEVGSQHVEANAHGRVLRVLERVDPVPGEDLYLHLDIKLQIAAAQALAGTRGAVVAMDVATGGVLALVSTPSFDANLFVTGISYADYKNLSQSLDLPLFNRAIQGQYPPGSTLKPMIGLGGLDTGATNTERQIRDPGFYRLENSSHRYRDWKKWGHGNNVDLRQAIVESCDTYFYDLAVRMGIDQMHPVGAAFGLGEKTGIDMPNERAGLWPSRDWKREERRLPWFPGDSLNVSIGQGDVLATPLQLSLMTSVLASRGELRVPRIVRQIGSQAVNSPVLSHYPSTAENWDFVNAAMEDVVHGNRGTAKVIAEDANYRIAGKTGTAQVVGIAQGEEYDRDSVRERNRDHALFVAYAPAQNPEIAIAVIIENGEHGSSAAAPVARKVLDTWFTTQTARREQQQQPASNLAGSAAR